MKIGYIGLGKMGLNMVERLIEKGYSAIVFDKDEEASKRISKKGAHSAPSLAQRRHGNRRREFSLQGIDEKGTGFREKKDRFSGCWSERGPGRSEERCLYYGRREEKCL